MNTRTHIPLKTKLAAMCLRFTCPVCGKKLGPLDGLDWDHVQPVALGGTNDPENLQPLHKACHRLKTSGSKATSYGSDVFNIAKTKRLADGPKPSRNKMPKTGRKIPSRQFEKRRMK